MKKTFFILPLFFLSLVAPAQNVVTAANAFLKSLGPELKAKATFSYDSAERFNWFFVPIDRKGATFHDFNAKQKEAALQLLKASLSEQGYKKATDIMALEAILRVLEGRPENDTRRDPLKYYFSIFGTPAKNSLWGWRIEGHHLSLNYSAKDGSIAAGTPMFWGSNPAVVPSGPEKGKIILKKETDLAFQLVNSFTPEQLAIARFSEKALPDIITFNHRKGERLTPEGINYKAMNADQQKTFMLLLTEYVNNYPFDFASSFMAKIKKAGIENLSFAWAGNLKAGPNLGHYYRIQGPLLLIEYDNTQTEANHIHSVVRDLTNDFADDILQEHYKKEHHKKP